MSFDILVKRQISRLEQPGIQCVDLVYEELQRISSQSEPSELTRFPVLRDRLVEVVSALLKRCVGPTQMMVSNLVKIELAVSRTAKSKVIIGADIELNLGLLKVH
jgi:dynamin 1-like protein